LGTLWYFFYGNICCTPVTTQFYFRYVCFLSTRFTINLLPGIIIISFNLTSLFHCWCGFRFSSYTLSLYYILSLLHWNTRHGALYRDLHTLAMIFYNTPLDICYICVLQFCVILHVLYLYYRVNLHVLYLYYRTVTARSKILYLGYFAINLLT
jgi:hypothetical protein